MPAPAPAPSPAPAPVQRTRPPNIPLIAGAVAAIAVIALAALFVSRGGFRNLLPGLSPTTTPEKTGVVVRDELKVPDTKKITGDEARYFTEPARDVALVPKNEGERIIAPQAVLTLKGAYALAAPSATSWNSNAKPVFIRSLGTVTLDGKSTQWQIAFATTGTARGYEVIVQEDSIVSKKEVESSAKGYDVPRNETWYDSGDAIRSVQNLPQFSKATVSAISFFYNPDGKEWMYALETSSGNTTMHVK